MANTASTGLLQDEGSTAASMWRDWHGRHSVVAAAVTDDAVVLVGMSWCPGCWPTFRRLAGSLLMLRLDPIRPVRWSGLCFLARWMGNPCLLSLRLERVWYGMKRLWRNYSLSITLAGLFFVSWIGQLVTQWFTWANDQQEHNQPLEVGDFLWQFWTSTLENWQSEFLQLLTFVVLTTFLIHRNSHESRDSDDEMQKSLDRIEKWPKALEGEGGKAKAGSSS
jgi:hypothetical protein